MAERSAKFAKVKGYFDRGLWNREMVLNAAGRWITQAEALEIVGDQEVSQDGA